MTHGSIAHSADRTSLRSRPAGLTGNGAASSPRQAVGSRGLLWPAQPRAEGGDEVRLDAREAAADTEKLRTTRRPGESEDSGYRLVDREGYRREAASCNGQHERREACSSMQLFVNARRGPPSGGS